ncbi:MAG: ABC transporter permease, partial [Desulfobacterales bacterium]|nr:ABC transporter permease [Desulfobacterales bacterium]
MTPIEINMKYFGKKLLRLFAIVLAVSALTFLMVDLLPGDVAYEIAGEEASLSDIEAIREELGLNRNIFVRYAAWISE